MQISKTVVINCAGIGSRLGFGKTKALIEIEGKPIIARQLDMLTEVEDVRIVVGFQAEQVIETVLAIRKEVIFVFNHEYHSTGTAHSFYLGSRHSNQWVISLDGDLLVHPHDFQQFIQQDQACLGFCEPITQEPVFVNIKNINNQTMITDFSRESGQYEWTGLLQINANDITTFTGKHIYQACEGKLPMPGMLVNAREIDTPADFDQAVNWMKEIERRSHSYDQFSTQ
jgi:choline kinase